MTPHTVVPVVESSQVGDARRRAAGLADVAGLDEQAAGRLALVVTELATNLARHAKGGRLLLAAHPSRSTVEVLSIDDGPGMADVARCMGDGFSSGGTPGNGLGAVQRQSSSFEIFSVFGHCTLVHACVGLDGAPLRHAGAVFDVGAVCTAAPGETVSGDGWKLRQDGARATLMVADGLGHGPDAEKASDAALQVFSDRAFAAPSDVLNHAHDALRSLRGAAVAVATLDDGARNIVFCGAGNIAGRIISGVEDRSLMSQHGTVGLAMRRLQDVDYPWPPHALLVLHSDGINTRWKLDEAPGLLQAGPAIIAAWLLRTHCRGRDDATVVVVRLH